MRCRRGASFSSHHVILGDVVDRAVLDAIKRKLDEDTAELLRRGGWGTGQFARHLSQSMPRSKEHIYSDRQCRGYRRDDPSSSR